MTTAVGVGDNGENIPRRERRFPRSERRMAMEKEKSRRRSWIPRSVGVLWGRLFLLVFPLTLIFLAFAIPLSVKTVRSDMRSREEEILAAHGALLKGLREETASISGPVLRQEHMTDRARRVVLDEMVRTVFQAVGEQGAAMTENGEILASSGTVPTPEFPEEEGHTAGRLVFLRGNDVQKRRTEETDRILYTAVTAVELESRRYVVFTGQDVLAAYESAERAGTVCRRIYGILLAAVVAGGVVGSVLLLVRGRRRGRRPGGRGKRISPRFGLILAGALCLAAAAGLLLPQMSAAMARGGFRKTQTMEESGLPVSEQALASVPDGAEMVRMLTTRAYADAEFGVEPYVSAVDGDGDGIDDQTDILQSALAYVAKKPAYLSEYYTTGYPTGNNGVCTYVIAYGFLGAGYDLMSLVWEDVLMNPAYYPNSTDENIDFRRVENDLSFFSRNAAESLTTDVYDTDAWRAGDIVVFEKHIGFVADVRNYKGVPWLLHHGREGQTEYVEDHLEESRDLIVAHFRWR